MNEEQANLYDDALRRGRRERLVDYAIGGAMVAILFVIAMFIVPLIPVALAEPPVTIENIRVLTPMPVCPGDFIDFTATVHVNEPSIIGIWTAIMNEDQNILNHTRAELEPVPRPSAISFEEEIHFRVPDLPAGNYTRVAAFAAINSDTKPTYTLVPFVVDEDCPPIE